MQFTNHWCRILQEHSSWWLQTCFEMVRVDGVADGRAAAAVSSAVHAPVKFHTAVQHLVTTHSLQKTTKFHRPIFGADFKNQTADVLVLSTFENNKFVLCEVPMFLQERNLSRQTSFPSPAQNLVISSHRTLGVTQLWFVRTRPASRVVYRSDQLNSAEVFTASDRETRSATPNSAPLALRVRSCFAQHAAECQFAQNRTVHVPFLPSLAGLSFRPRSRRDRRSQVVRKYQNRNARAQQIQLARFLVKENHCAPALPPPTPPPPPPTHTHTHLWRRCSQLWLEIARFRCRYQKEPAEIFARNRCENGMLTLIRITERTKGVDFSPWVLPRMPSAFCGSFGRFH